MTMGGQSSQEEDKEMKMTFYLKNAKTDRFRRVSKKVAMDFMEKTHGKGSFEKRIGEARKFPPYEPMLIFIWEDFQIKKFSKEEDEE